jgi:hypothetical protein
VCTTLSSTLSDLLRDDAKAAAKLEADCNPSTILAQADHEPCTWEQFKDFEARFVKPLLEAENLSELWLHPQRSAHLTAAAAAASAATTTAPEDTQQQQQQLHLTAICLFDVQAGQVVVASTQRCCSKSCAQITSSNCQCNSNNHSCGTSWLRGSWLQLVRCACSHLSAAVQKASSTASGKHRLEAVLHIPANTVPATCCEAVYIAAIAGTVYIAAIAGTQLCVVIALPAAAVIAARSSLMSLTASDDDCTAGCRALRNALPELQASFAVNGAGGATHLTAHNAAVLQPELRAQLQAVCARVEHAFPPHDVLQQLASSGRVPSPFQLQPVAPAAPQQIRSKQQQQPYMHSGRTLKCSTALQTSSQAAALVCRADSTPSLTVERLVAEHALRAVPSNVKDVYESYLLMCIDFLLVPSNAVPARCEWHIHTFDSDLVYISLRPESRVTMVTFAPCDVKQHRSNHEQEPLLHQCVHICVHIHCF